MKWDRMLVERTTRAAKSTRATRATRAAAKTAPATYWQRRDPAGLLAELVAMR